MEVRKIVSINLKYGRENLELSLPEEDLAGVLYPNFDLTGTNPELELLRSIKNPIKSNRLKEIVKRNETVAIVTSDITRPVPSRTILPFVVEELIAGGIRAEDITIVFALGSHRKHTEEEKAYLAGEYVIGQGIRCIDNDPNNCRNFGRCKNGTPVDLFSTVADADRIVCIGNVEYHYFAGYSGGAKALMPGVSSKEAIQCNHTNMLNPAATAGKLDGNPVREDIDEVGQHIKIDFIVNVVLNEEKQISRAFSGHYIAAHRAACEYLDKAYEVSIDHECGIVVVSAGGFPKDINMYQAQKALDNARIAVRQGGIIIWVASMQEGFGSVPFQTWICNKSHQQILEDIKNNFVLGAHKAAAMAQTMKKAQVFVISDLSAEVIEKIGARAFGTIEEAYSAAVAELKQKEKVLVLPHGGATLPVVANRG